MTHKLVKMNWLFYDPLANRNNGTDNRFANNEISFPQICCVCVCKLKQSMHTQLTEQIFIGSDHEKTLLLFFIECLYPPHLAYSAHTGINVCRLFCITKIFIDWFLQVRFQKFWQAYTFNLLRLIWLAFLYLTRGN